MRTNAYNRETSMLFKDGQRYTLRNILGEPGAGKTAMQCIQLYSGHPTQRKGRSKSKMVPGVKPRTPVTWKLSPNPEGKFCLQDFRINVNPFPENGAGFFFPRFQETAPPEETVESEELVSAAT